jgi:hypothetical protein
VTHSESRLIEYLSSTHQIDGGDAYLPSQLHKVCRAIALLAKEMDAVPQCQDKAAGMQKLIEARDCFVRAVLSLEIESIKAIEESERLSVAPRRSN